MKVYVVNSVDWDYSYTAGVFSTEEKAREFMGSKWRQTNNGFELNVHELDEPAQAVVTIDAYKDAKSR